MSRKPRAIKLRGPMWESLANGLARSLAPSIYACGDCGYPVAKGYCCTFCGSDTPEVRPRLSLPASPPLEEKL